MAVAPGVVTVGVGFDELFAADHVRYFGKIAGRRELSRADKTRKVKRRLPVVLSEFIVANRREIIARALARASARSGSRSLQAKLKNGVPLFLSQLVDALEASASARQVALADAADGTTRINESASLHGRELLDRGFTVPQVVYGYGDVCQVVTELATEREASISTHDFHVFNLCLDDAIAGAVSAYAIQRERDLAFEGTERLGTLAHELRNLLNTAVLTFDVMKRGTVGLSGSTAAMHGRSLGGLRALVERSLAEVRLDAGRPRVTRMLLAELIEEVAVVASMQAEGHALHLRVDTDGGDATIEVDQQLIMSAISNLLQNAFKFTKPDGTVTLITRTTPERVLIEVADECGGLPPGAADTMFQPFSPVKSDASGLGLGLTIARRAAEANAGGLDVRDVPGTGCVFTIDLPRVDVG